MNITELKQNVDLIELNDKQIYLVGTAHVSSESAELVEEAILEYEPDTVCIELCQPRLESISNKNRWQETNIYEVIKSGKAYILLTQLFLSGFQKRIAEKLDIRPGEEMLRALEVSKRENKEVEVIDREIRTTLKRAWASASLWILFKIFISLIASLFTRKEVSKEEIEKLKTNDALSVAIEEFAGFMPGLKEALIDERDLFMTEKLRLSTGKKIVAVVGAGHVPGIKKALSKEIDLEELNELPPPRLSVKIIAWVIPFLVIGAVIYGFFSAGAEASLEMIKVWFIANGTLSAIGAAIALAHPLTVLTAFLAAPFTSLNPMIAAGWVCGLLEAVIRKPRVKDLENITNDVATLSGFWKNRVTKILLIMAFANIGSVAGTFVGGIMIKQVFDKF